MKRGATRLIFAVFLTCVAVANVRKGDAFEAAMASAGAMCWLWLWLWMEDE